VGIGHAADAPSTAHAQSISLSGSMGQRALLVIDGTPHTLAPGASFGGIKLIGISEGDAQIEVDGKRTVLHLGVPVNLSAAQRPGAGTQIVMTAGSGGHFMTSGSINGAAVDFLVDTGATLVSISQADADRIGLKYRDSQRGMSQTANGNVMIYYVRLDKLRIGDVEVYDVPATVIPAQMSFVLLGNSYLTRFQMKRENDKMTLDKR
jgi:aspartyl protease family protein